MKLTSSEQDYIEKLSSISGIDASVVQDVFYSLLLAMVLEVYSGNNEITLPYICKFSVTTSSNLAKKSKKINARYDIETSPHLHEALLSVLSDDKTNIEDTLKMNLAKFISNTLDIDAK